MKAMILSLLVFGLSFTTSANAQIKSLICTHTVSGVASEFVYTEKLSVLSDSKGRYEVSFRVERMEGEESRVSLSGMSCQFAQSDARVFKCQSGSRTYPNSVHSTLITRRDLNYSEESLEIVANETSKSTENPREKKYSSSNFFFSLKDNGTQCKVTESN